MFTYFVLLASFVPLFSAIRHPILLVPGLGGSQIYGKFYDNNNGYLCHKFNETFSAWINLKFMVPFLVECTVSMLKLDYNTTSRQTNSPDYCQTEIPGFGTVDTIDNLSKNKESFTTYYGNLINQLVQNLKYTRNVNIRGAPYDFRKGQSESDNYLNRVKLLIEDMYRDSNNTPTIIVAHSLGNIHMLRLLNTASQDWKDKYIRAFISISAPYGGSLVSLRAILSGFRSADIIIKELNLRQMESTWPSLYSLLPNPLIWPTGTIVMTKDANFTVNQIRKLLSLSKINNTENHFDDAKKYFTQVIPPRVEVFCVFSDQIKTPGILDYRATKFPNGSPYIITTNGDSTVSMKSLMVCPQWKNQQTEPVSLFILPKVPHINMVRAQRAVDQIEKIILNINS